MTNKIIREEFTHLHEDFKTGVTTEYFKPIYKIISISIKKNHYTVAKINSIKENMTLTKYIEGLIKNDK